MAVTDGIREYMARDWGLLERSKEMFWDEQQRLLGAEEMLRIGSELWAWAKTLHPGWPTDTDREADLRAHTRLADLLRRADAARRS